MINYKGNIDQYPKIMSVSIKCTLKAAKSELNGAGSFIFDDIRDGIQYKVIRVSRQMHMDPIAPIDRYAGFSWINRCIKAYYHLNSYIMREEVQVTNPKIYGVTHRTYSGKQ